MCHVCLTKTSKHFSQIQLNAYDFEACGLLKKISMGL